mgnify:CR=1 FL=1
MLKSNFIQLLSCCLALHAKYFMENNVDKVKDKVDIVDLISSYLKLQKSGVNYKANCPFHNEKTPSFIVSPERQVWHCFGCSKGGDHFTFVQEIEGVDFPEALRLLARRAGIELEQFDRSFQNTKTRLLTVVELASKFFQKQLWESNSGQKALAYLKDRGLQEEGIKDLILEDQENKPEVYFIEMAEFSLNFKLMVWLNDYKKRFSTKDKLNTIIYNEFKRKKIAIPFPTRTIYMKKR